MLCVLPTIHTENIGILSGLHCGGKKYIDPKAREADLRMKQQIGSRLSWRFANKTWGLEGYSMWRRIESKKIEPRWPASRSLSKRIRWRSNRRRSWMVVQRFSIKATTVKTRWKNGAICRNLYRQVKFGMIVSNWSRRRCRFWKSEICMSKRKKRVRIKLNVVFMWQLWDNDWELHEMRTSRTV